jgi:pSer/pThr/pTyr-binding forkhead associated (FHA) protein
MLGPNMGVLIRCANGERHRLASRFLVGRSPSNHLRLPDSWISAVHAELLWKGSAWELHDLGSRNGTYIDGERLEAGARKAVSDRVEIAFGDVGDPFRLLDAGPPMAVALSNDDQRRESEAGLLILPDPEAPICTICYDLRVGWVVEWNDGAREQLAHDATLVAGKQTWRLELPRIVDHTWDPTGVRVNVASSTMQITLRDPEQPLAKGEEPLEIRLLQRDRVLRLPDRTYNRLLLALAEHRLEDEAAGTPHHKAGWLDIDDVLDLLDMDEVTFNVYISRARRDVAKLAVEDAASFIQRRLSPRRVRLGVRKVEIIEA